MMLRSLLCAMLWLTPGPPPCRATDARLEGCPNPVLLAKVVTRLRGLEWQNLSVAGVRAMWPAALDGLECAAESCSSLSHRGRIIGGHCQCCETFYFDVTRGSDGRRQEALDAVVIDYSSAGRNEAVATAKGLATAAGLSEDKVATVGRDRSQQFSWQDSQRQHILILNAKFARVGSVWTVYFYFSQNRIG